MKMTDEKGTSQNKHEKLLALVKQKQEIMTRINKGENPRKVFKENGFKIVFPL